MTAVVCCSTEGKCLPVLCESISQYVPEDIPTYLSLKDEDMAPWQERFIILPNEATNFGDAYNTVVAAAFADGHKDVILCNDDVVLRPDTWNIMLEDIESYKGQNIGYIAARSDWARGWQNIRTRHLEDDSLDWLRWPTERFVLSATVIAPIFAWITKEAWIDFPPINWFSDDVQCMDILRKGYTHRIGRFYVHHVGSQTVGFDADKLTNEAINWLRVNRPDLKGIFF